MTVTLADYEIEMAAFVGMKRNADSIIAKRTPRFAERKVGEMWAHHIVGAQAELAVAKALGAYWGGNNRSFHVPDIEGTNFEVRWSMRDDVKVRPDDTGVVIGVRGACPNYEIVGWLYAKQGMREEWKAFHNTPNPAFFVPHDQLRPFSELVSRIRAKQATQISVNANGEYSW
jgi:hypothetical protein